VTPRDSRFVRDVDWALLLATLALVGVGATFIYSAQPQQDYWIKQLTFLGAGLVVMAVIAFSDYRRLSGLSPVIYGGAILALIVVLIIGEKVNGARAWISFGGPFRIQPSEMAKLATILLLGRYLARPRRGVLSGREMVISGLIVLLPVALILLQPDTGTVLTFFPVLLAMLFLSGLRKRMLAVAAVAATLAVALAWGLVLKTYQKERIHMAFTIATGQIEEVDVSRRRGQGYQSIQSMIAVGSGGLTGKGILQGTQGRLGFLPERHTDFIASVISEETGFLGATVLLLLYAVLTWRLVAIARLAPDRFGSLIVMGLAALFIFHVFVNLGMVVGLVPIMGIPLPLVSYGGSSLLVLLTGIGVALNVRLRRFVN
jgi:rod shape determining protein RodA